MSGKTKEFIDTNILVYAYDNTAGKKHDVAKKLLRKLWENKTGVLSLQVFQELYVVLTKKIKNPLSPDEALELIKDYTYWEIHLPGINDFFDAIKIQKKFKISFWDAMIINSAIKMNCQVIWSEDLNPGQEYDRVKALSPFL